MNRKIISIFLLVFTLSIVPGILSFFIDNNFLLAFRWVMFIGAGIIIFRFLESQYYRLDSETQNDINNKIKYVFLLFLLLVTISSLNFDFIKPVNEFLRPLQTRLTISTIFFGFLTFYLNREVIGKIEKEKQEEDEVEMRREKEFSKKFPRLNKVPILRSISNWAYKESIWYVVGLILILVLGFSLRFVNLNHLDPYTDEYNHLNGAKDLIQGKGLNYFRSRILTYSVAIFFKIFGVSVFAGRLPVIIFNTFTAIPLYFIGRKFDKKLGLLFGFLYMVSPWAIATSRTVREYGFFPFFFALITLFLIDFYFQISYSFKKKDLSLFFTRKFFFKCIIFIFPIIYSFFLNPASTFKSILLEYGVFFAFLSFNIFYSYKSNLFRFKPLFIVFGLYALLSLGLWKYITQFNSFIKFPPSFHKVWYDYSLFRAYWFSSNIIYYLIIFVSIFFVFYSLYKLKKNKSFPLLLVSFFLLNLFFFSFFFVRYNRPRYAFPTLLFYVFVIGLGLYFLLRVMILQKSTFNWSALMILLIFLLVSFNYSMFFTSFTMGGGGYKPITGECHDAITPFIEKYGSLIESNDSIVCSLCAPLKFYLNLDLDSAFAYNYRDEFRMNNTIDFIENHTSGWMILDWRRNNYWSSGFPKENISISNGKIEFLGVYSGFYVYKW